MKAHDFARQLLNGPDGMLLVRFEDDNARDNVIEVEPENIELNSDATDFDNVTIDLDP